MVQRLAAVSALMVFAVCLLVGGFAAGNPFVSAVERALVAMLGTLILGLVVGWMAQKMLEESVVPPAGHAGSVAGPTTEVAGATGSTQAGQRARPDAEGPGGKKV